MRVTTAFLTALLLLAGAGPARADKGSKSLPQTKVYLYAFPFSTQAKGVGIRIPIKLPSPFVEGEPIKLPPAVDVDRGPAKLPPKVEGDTPKSLPDGVGPTRQIPKKLSSGHTLVGKTVVGKSGSSTLPIWARTYFHHP
jgi:hypothetical protein